MCAAFRSESTIACGRDSVLDNAETRLRGSNCAIICTLTSESLGDKVLRTLASTFVIMGTNIRFGRCADTGGIGLQSS